MGVAVMCSVLPVFGGNQAVAQAYNDQVLRLNRRLYALCVDTGVRYVDYHSQMTAEDGRTLRADLSWDGVHPHVLGYNRMANALAPVLEELDGDLAGKVKVAKVNVDEEPELARRFGVMSIPTVVFLKNGQEFDRKVGVMPPQAFSGVLDTNL